jgi:hypothetical protein
MMAEDIIPLDLWQHVFEYCPASFVKRVAASVCHSWRTIATSDEIWNMFCVRDGFRLVGMVQPKGSDFDLYQQRTSTFRFESLISSVPTVVFVAGPKWLSRGPTATCLIHKDNQIASFSPFGAAMLFVAIGPSVSNLRARLRFLITYRNAGSDLPAVTFCLRPDDKLPKFSPTSVSSSTEAIAVVHPRQERSIVDVEWDRLRGVMCLSLNRRAVLQIALSPQWGVRPLVLSAGVAAFASGIVSMRLVDMDVGHYALRHLD